MKKVSLWLLLAVIYACAIFVGSSIPSQELPNIVTLIWDKVLHVGEYSVFGFLVHRALTSQTRFPKLQSYAFIVAIGITSLYGASDELHQLFVPGRSCELQDWFADSIGSIAGVLFSVFVWQKFSRRGTKRV